MKQREIYSNLKVFPPFAVRIDGCRFHRLLSNFKKPYDEKFTKALVDSVVSFFKDSGFSPIFAFLFSDEINLFFYQSPYNYRIEKINSIIPSFISSCLTINLNLKKPISFDSRIILLGKEDIYEYLVLRQAETWRNYVNSYGFYTLLESGISENDAANQLKNMKAKEIHELVFQHGINLAKNPEWQRRGITIYKLNVKTTRKKIIQN